MTIESWLKKNSQALVSIGIQTGRLDCQILLSDEVNKDKSWILANTEYVITESSLIKLNKQIKHRSKHIPLAYIRGKSEFYGRQFLVNKHTLQPRPETETMLELFTQLYKSQKPSLVEDSLLSMKENVNWVVVDAGTGSGAIGISLKIEFPELEVFATDISKDCLIVAKQNAKKYNANISFILGNILEPIQDKNITTTTAIMANLPYVPNKHKINLSAEWEPKIAIFGGADGLDLYRRLFSQISKFGNEKAPKYVFTESLPTQHIKLKNIAQNTGYILRDTEDFIQVFKLN